MSSANVELLRSIYTAWERGDFRSTTWAHPEIEFVLADGPDPGRWRGLSEVAEALRTMLDAWEGYRIQAEEFRELDGERVLVLTRNSGRGQVSGLEIEQKRAQLHHIRRGKVTRWVYYHDRDRALADLGLAPEASSPAS
jgi:ketosteroid isomerase-like protein